MDQLKIGPHCYLQYYANWGVSLCYAERSPDPWYSDAETEVDIDPAKAVEIIAWLQAKYPELVASRRALQGGGE